MIDNDESRFIGREWLFEYLLKYLADEQSKLLFIVGSQGSGKTAICREIEKISKSSIEKSIINNRCLKILYLNEEPISNRTGKIKDELNLLLIEKYADYYDLNRSESSLEATLSLFGQKNFSQHKSFIMIDNMHVCSNEELLDLIGIFNRLPAWLNVVMTCDSRYFKSHRFLRRRFPSISIDERSSRDDIERFVKFNTNLPIEQLKPLIDKSENNFSFVSKSVELVNEGFIRPFEFKSIKPGLNGLYTLLLTRFRSLFIGDDSKLAYSILSLFTSTSRRDIGREYVYKRVKLRYDHISNFDLIFYTIKRLFLDSTSSKLFHSTLREKLANLRDEANACETLFYWLKLCKFESQLTRKTSTPLVPIASIEFIDQDLLSTSSSTPESDLRHQRHLFYLNQFRRFYSSLSGCRQNQQIESKMDEILELYKRGSQSPESSFVLDYESFDVSIRQTDYEPIYKPKIRRNSSILSHFSIKFFSKLCC